MEGRGIRNQQDRPRRQEIPHPSRQTTVILTLKNRESAGGAWNKRVKPPPPIADESTSLSVLAGSVRRQKPIAVGLVHLESCGKAATLFGASLDGNAASNTDPKPSGI